MKTTLLSKKYKIEDKGTNGKKLKIYALALADGSINIFNQKFEKEFVFENSKPAMIFKIGKMITKAGGLTT